MTDGAFLLAVDKVGKEKLDRISDRGIMNDMRAIGYKTQDRNLLTKIARLELADCPSCVLY